MDQTITYEKKLHTAQKCVHCGAQMKQFPHSLSKGLVESFVKLAFYARDTERSAVHLRDDIRLGSTEYNNFNKLKYWGIVKMHKRGSGKWELTEKGIDFLNNRIALPVRVWTFRNRVVERDRNLANIADIDTGHTTEFWQNEFCFKIVDSKIVPVTDSIVQEELFI